MRSSLPAFSAVPLFVIAVASSLTASPVAESPKVDFAAEIYPVFQRSCFECHGPEKQKGHMRLDRPIDPANDKDGIVVPGKSAESEMIRRISLPAGDEDVMPNRGTLLTAAEIDKLKRWIDQGASWPANVELPVHWSYIKPTRPKLPAVRDGSWPKNAVDYFVLAKLEGEKLAPSPPAPREELLRRVSLILTGLPPSPEEVSRFLADNQADAYERVVDRLLASPRFGERWARPWLDLARYADSNGLQRDGFRDVWPYRDWVIAALNQDMPFDEFTIEQLAGDLLPSPTLQQKIATGFNRCTTANVEAGVDEEEGRVNQVLDRVNTTATVWLGSTLECTQCHDHKFDRFKHKDYYRFLAIYNSTKKETVSDPETKTALEFVGPYAEYPIPEDRRHALEDARQRQTAVVAEIGTLSKRYLETDQSWEDNARVTKLYLGKPIPNNISEVIALPAAQRDVAQLRALDDFRLSFHPDAQALVEQRNVLDVEVRRLSPDRSLVMEELETPRETHIFTRGNFLTPGELVEPGVPDFIGPKITGPVDRLTLARWLVSPENPLVPRVTVNRWWSEIFGLGLVATPEDFGVKGERPTHPELLDWLAVELVEGGWSMKHLLRTLVTSATFQQASATTPELRALDPKNTLYARGPRFRMDAEMIRDNALAISGLLSAKLGGPPVRPYQPENIWRVVGNVNNTYAISEGEDRHRRGIYTVWRRSAPYPSFMNFDAPARNSCTVKRSRSNTPLQSLTLLNDPVYVESALRFAQRVLDEEPTASLEQRIKHAFNLSVAREPVPREMATMIQLYATMHDRYAAAPALARQVVGRMVAKDPVELAAWQTLATVLLNLDETISIE